MSIAPPFPIRKECPPGACVCGREALLVDRADAGAGTEPAPADLRVLSLTREEERKLLAHIEQLASYEELLRLEQRLRSLLGVELRITPSARGVRTVRGLAIELLERPGLCRKTREAVPAALRRRLDQQPEIVYALLNARDLLGE
ncbi:hypothetical protein ACFOLJ_22080 [Rugamonas sp. CCM 8940]|uniref:hypothetical protein n=1 Tax=Rugamonas sp. CCM 8940 TaxID=2765359 RepID=UPI0018F5EF59|nr:hypothetical protein [Rugamonas sp. CCM 8940]MBJ7310620.1 hypothetical protein [Rugamonas sp. CCM 8940]